MHTVAQYLEWAERCGKMAARTPWPNKRALELIAAAWENAAEQRKAQLEKEAKQRL